MATAALALDPMEPAALLGAIDACPGGTQIRAAAAGLDPDARAYLVGGAVRDLLLGRRPRELDVAIDGDPAQFLDALGGSEVARHERFGTATVELPDVSRVDIARTRAEEYAHPGALPDVEWAPLAIDLHRRDATLNAIAVDLVSGELHAESTALADLAARILRVLHPRSFEDDPTRLWRLARYEVRLGADWDPVTFALAQRAVAGGAPRAVAPERLGSELRLALAEPDPYGALAALGRLDLPPRFDLDAERLHDAQQLGDGLADPADLALAALCSDDPELERQLTRREEVALIDAARLLRGAGGDARRPGPLPADAPGSQIAARFDGLPLAAVCAAPDTGAARRWIRELRHLGLAVDGEDLLADGIPRGPAIGRGLAAAREAVLDGRVDPGDRHGQLEIARSARSGC